MPAPGWTTLNAYVDGELDAPAAAAVAEAAGRDTEIADQIAALYALRGVSHDVLSDAPPDLSAVIPKRRVIWPAALAACIAAAIMVGTALWTMLPAARAPALPKDLITRARTLHADWLAAEARGTANTPPAVLLAALNTFGAVPVVPDLRSTELAIDLVKVAEGPEGRMLQVGYRGHHGCHLSLFAFVDRRMPKAVVRVDDGDARAYSWRVGDLGYLLFAVGMDQSRLALIADTVEQATRTHAPLGAEARQQLAQNKQHSTTCHA